MSAPSTTSTPRSPTPTEPSPDSRFGQLATEDQIRATVAALLKNGIQATLVADRAEAVRVVVDLIPPGSEVLDATSQTLVALGLNDALADPSHFHNIRQELMRLRQENKADAQRKLGAAPDVVVGSVHAVTETGQVVIASASGSQLAPYAYGAGKVIWVVGTQKIVPDLDAAFQRVQEYALPRESERAQKAYGFSSFVAKLLVISREFQPGRIHLILIRENLGF
jgi:L-lactate utilization protein LutC